MTNKEAIERLKWVEKRISDITYSPESFEALEIAIKALEEKPTGEWIAREDMDYLDENKVEHKHFECNKCGLIHDFIDGHTSSYNFCPNCGAKMKID